MSNLDYDKTTFAGLTGDEQKWEKKLVESGK
jgi:hypothetical protein